MEKEFNNFLAKRGILDEEYKSASIDIKAKLVEAFENSKPKGKLSLSCTPFINYFLVFLDHLA